MTTGFTDGRSERLAELLASDWGDALTAEERAELERLAAEAPDEVLELERAAGAACVVFAARAPAPPLPADLRARIEAQAEAHFASTAPGRPGAAASTAPAAPRVLDGGVSGAPNGPVRAAAETAAAGPRHPGLVWWGALAAAIALAVAGWLPRLGPPPPPREPLVVERVVEPPPPPSPAERLQRLEALAEATRTIPWTTTEDPWVETVDGRVVWNNELQEGYMTFAGLPKNDPTEHRYQLWIFDATRDERFPVDGGIFDVDAEGAETIVPIEAKLPVGEPTLFAVTLEGPDGVVVSDREHILVVAQVN